MDVEPCSRVADDLQHLDKVPEGAPKPIGGPDGYHVELSTDGSLQQRIELRALVTSLGAADALVLVDADHHMAGTFRPGFELLTLRVGGRCPGQASADA